MSELTQKEEEDGDIGLIDENANFFADYMSKNFKVKKGLFPFKGGLPSFFRDPICTFKWEKLFEGVFEVRVDVVNRFYKEIPIDIGEIICEHIHAWVKHPRGARPFLHLIEELCFQAMLEWKKHLRTASKHKVRKRVLKPTRWRLMKLKKKRLKNKVPLSARGTLRMRLLGRESKRNDLKSMNLRILIATKPQASIFKNLNAWMLL
ncbi:hypothetical protein E5676_scaffold598G00290 [Cucumis melo var. makuwa]|uniref:Uncharacterized protein n=1 Tax=Cucumis melo var. makuwa TaxID=1194695 RepID=A0A5D3BCA5_CUCMM|nr:hypothetical protein E6C27_scaffold38G001890 [Cucumis melo var. makuwa]TYJ97470.1 hypothetical protein E5676_scaffold598G00290 [Cucumis melo var. makuwa]